MPLPSGIIRATPHGPDRPDDWRAQAACADDPSPDRWFPISQSGDTSAMKALCATCPVIFECLDDAMADPHRYGIWGGTTESERARIRKGPLKKPGPQREPIVHGTARGEKAHYRRGEKPCEPCRKAAYAARLRRKSA